MMNSGYRFAHDEAGVIYRFINLPRRVKKLIIMSADFVLLSLVLWGVISARLMTFYVPETLAFGLLLASAPAIGVVVFYASGLYQLVTRYISSRGSLRICSAVAISVLLWGLVILLSGMQGVPRSVILIYGLLGACATVGSRQLAGWFLTGVYNFKTASFDAARTNVIIYGAGGAAVLLAKVLEQNGTYRMVGLIDDDDDMWGHIVGGHKVYSPAKLSELISRHNAEEIFLALPEATRSQRLAIVRALKPYKIAVKTLPNIADIASGRVAISDLRPINVDDLLGREAVPADPALLGRNVTGKVVLVTGAGGSIGSELTRQVLKLGPERLILFEQSETALYEIENELVSLRNNLLLRPNNISAVGETDVIPVLGSVLDEGLVRSVLGEYDVDTIYHAAAYKHVPIVESNIAVGVKNNTLGTHVVARAARDAGVGRFVLVSTDKAVRPTSIMGASKRLAELILQAHAKDPDCQTVFSMVRFGNVLDSSGSVVRLFRKQIQEGGPVTVTHADMVRYFMSIPEASELVIQAGALAGGGDVFVLDMGEPVKILDLATMMIRLAGLEVKSEDNPHGDIEIDIVGLRPGEKLYEELLIGGNVTGTRHPRIMRSEEPALEWCVLQLAITRLDQAVSANDVKSIVGALCGVVEGYVPDKALDELHALPIPDRKIRRLAHPTRKAS